MPPNSFALVSHLVAEEKKPSNSLKKQLPDRGGGNLAASRTSEVTD